jgi:thiamine biosynthesis lipoprotein
MKPASKNKSRRAQPHLGTFVEIEAVGLGRRDRDQAIDQAFAEIATVHRLMSAHTDDSDVGRLNRARYGDVTDVDAWTYHVLEVALAMHKASHGAFDINVGSTMKSLGRLPSVEQNSFPKTSTGCASIELLGGHRVRLKREGIKIDLGGIAKGFAVDKATDVLRRHGLNSGIVNA